MKSALFVFVSLVSVLMSTDDAEGPDATVTDAGITPCWHLVNQKFLSAPVGLKAILSGAFPPLQGSPEILEPDSESRP